jgi:hypothetical protein
LREAAIWLRRSCKDRLPVGHYAKLDEECRAIDAVLSPNEPDEPQAAANPQRKIFPMTHEKGQAGPVGSMAGINKIVAAWRDMPAAEMRLRCGELKAQEIRTVRAVLNAILANAKDEPRHE